jgi:two-component system, NarL family, response regulator
MKQTIRVLIVDDHPIVNKGLVTLLSSESDMFIIGSSFSAQEALEVVQKDTIDIAIIDIRLPDMDGLKLTEMIKSIQPESKIIILTTFSDSDYIVMAIKAGANGYILKEASESFIVDSVRSVFKNRMVIYTEEKVSLPQDNIMTPLNVLDAKNLLGKLTQREQEIFQLLITGKDNNEISDELCISEHTVRNYVSRIYSSLQVKNRTAAILWAREQGLY